MAKRVFISFKYGEVGLRNDLLQFFQAYGGVVQATPTYVTTDVSSGGDEAIKREIRSKMQNCRGLIVVVGQDAHNSPWIGYELGLASSFRIPKVALRHPSRTGGLPNAHSGIPQVPWSPSALADVVDKW